MFAPEHSLPSAGLARTLAAQVTPFARLVLIVVPITLVGCSGTKDQSANSDSVDATESVPPVTADESAGQSTGEADSSQPNSTQPNSTQPNSTQPSASPAGPDLNEGLKLPAGADPTGQSGDPPSDEQDAGPAKPGEGGIEMPKESDAAAGSAVNLSIASWSEIESQAKTTGRITVVDLWSLSCAPCLKEFPGLVRLSKAMPQQVTCMGVSLDYDGRKSKPPESYSQNVTSFLNAVKSDFPNFLCSTPSDDVYQSIELPSIPAVLIFDAKGNLVKQFVDSGETIGFTYDKDVIPFVKNLAG